MKKTSPSKRWIFVALGVLGIGLYLYASIEIDPPGSVSEPLRVGNAEDVRSLADRDDLNVLFVLIDTLRADRMSAYGYHRDTTPFLSELSRTSVRFDRHIAQSSWTKSSMASLWSGLNPLRAGITKFDQTLSQEARLPAEILSESGFMTVGLYRNGWVHGYFGFDQGFDKYFRPMGSRVNRAVERTRPNELGHGTDENLVEEAIEFLRIHGKTSRWLLYLHLMDLHEYIYDAESALFGNATGDLYDNSLRRTDWIVSTLHDHLRSTGLLDETIIVIVSDHGEAFGERGFEGHARTVMPETTETPLILSLPFALEPGAVVKSTTANVDVWPTVLDLLGMPGQGSVDGKSRVPEIIAAIGGDTVEPANDPEEPIIAYLDQNWGKNVTEVLPAVSVLEGTYRYVSGLDVAGNPYEALLSQEDDQVANRIDAHPDITARLRTIAQDHLDTNADFEVKAIKLDEMQLDQLRALGYELP